MTPTSRTAERPAAAPAACAPHGFVRLVSVDRARNRFRFYTLSCEQTLWGEWAIRCAWGRIGGMGRSRIAYLGELGGVPEVLDGLLEHRLRRGYRATGHRSTISASR